ncbi:uncharacterized protein [Rutidosis leptorrhynchoides]|uniref:uncharacterized protein n=1 Tax=Rutidosis leptorrhynchoides TaxID=125765 RepID=UPI003A997D87
MVVCKCRKATKLYCFVHKVPVCGECICFPEHQICVVRTYSEWVIDGEYDWPTKCCHCQAVLEEGGVDSNTTRLGCLHVIHTNCLVSNIKSYPPHTAPAGYVCPACSTSIWPPKSIKDSGSRLHSHLKEAIVQTGVEKNVFGNNPVSIAAKPIEPMVTKDDAGNGSAKPSNTDIVEIDVPNSENHLRSPTSGVPGATTRKSAQLVERQNSEVSYYADDEDANRKKYSRRGGFRNQFLRKLLPFWSNTLPTLPVTAPPRKDANADDMIHTRHQHHNRPSRMDPRKILLVIAIMACLATMGILYYRIAQNGFGEEQPQEEQQ